MNERWTRNIAFSLFWLSLLAQPLVAYVFRGDTWDDSAITMAFARTFAHTGAVEGTPGSGVVEGYSTTLWMLLLAGVSKFVASPSTLLYSAKALTCLLTIANILLIRLLIRRWNQPVLADLTAAVFGLMELTFDENINGMENPLMLFLFLLAVLFVRNRNAVGKAIFLASSSLFLLCRHEAFLLLAPFLLLMSSWKRRITSVLVWFVVLVSEVLIRWRYFGSVLPNTIVAKRHYPYSMQTGSQELLRHLHPVLTLAISLAVVIPLVLYGLFFRRRDFATRDNGNPSLWKQAVNAFSTADDVKVSVLLAGTGLFLNFAIGANWGPPDREMYSALPFLVYLLLRAAFSLLKVPRLQFRAVALLLVLLVCTTARSMRRFSNPAAPVYMPFISVRAIASMVPPVEDIRTRAGLSSLTFAVPDVGGVMLFGDNLKILDTGLLCDPELAKHGYAIAPQYLLGERQPEVIELHGVWTDLTGLQKDPRFFANYRIVYMGRKRFFIRQDIFQKIASTMVLKHFKEDGHPMPSEDSSSIAVEYPHYGAVDWALDKSFGVYATPNGTK